MDEGDLPDPTVSLFFSPSPIPSTAAKEEEVVLTSWAILILVSLLLSSLFVSYLLERRRIRRIFLHETIVALGMGAAVGLVIRYIGDTEAGSSLRQMVSFDHRYFFNLILPPIILNSGYDLKRKSFFRNFGTILTFAFAGTLIASLVMGVLLFLIVSLHLTPVRMTFLDCMMFGSILSSTDPVTIIAIFNQLKVDPDLFAIVLGESMLNDAVAIVLFTTLAKFQDQQDGATLASFLSGILSFITVFSGSILIGSLIALLASLTLKHTHLHKHPSLESCIITLLAYSSYLLSNSIHLSGIVSLLFCAILLKHYGYDNMSLRTRRTTKHMFRVLSQLSENFVFIYLGVTLFSNQHAVFSVTLTFFTIGIVLASRYASILPLASLLNYIHPSPPLLPKSYQTILWWSGLRGAIAFALSFELSSPSAAAMRTTTLVVCVVSVIGLGGTVGHALEQCHIRTGVVEPGEDGESEEEEEDWEDGIALSGGEGVFVGRGRGAGRRGSGGGVRSVSEHGVRGSTDGGREGYGGEEDYFAGSNSVDRHAATAAISSSAGEMGDSEIEARHWFLDFDNKWMKPLFTRRRGTVYAPPPMQLRTLKPGAGVMGSSGRVNSARVGLLEPGRLPRFSSESNGGEGSSGSRVWRRSRSRGGGGGGGGRSGIGNPSGGASLKGSRDHSSTK
ncbi:monovalent cation:H+ antiporter, CPA1 (nhx1) [Podochytrium sp. JEL0797]|nr:monovalent cation:H+ antiporter, CPA1 (nhx1) [Podochytrium sp. JEL0797]